MKNIFGLILVEFLLFTSSNFYAQSGNLFGSVINNKDKAISLANVEVKELHLITITDKDGGFKINNLNIGKYTIIISHLGYKTFSQRVDINDGENFLIAKMNESPITLGEAIVRGTRSTEIAKNVAFPIESINSKEIELKFSDSVPDAVASAPGIQVARDGAWGTMLNVRGLSKQNLVYLIDGTRIETSTNIASILSMFNMDDIQKVEIIKGGLSVLYGTSATGGVVNILSKQPHYGNHFYSEGEINLGYKSVNRENAAGLSLFTGANKWKLKFSASGRKAGDVKIPDGYLTNSGFKDYSYSFSGGFRPTTNWEFTSEFQFYKANDVGIPGGAAFPPNALATYPEVNRRMFKAKILWRNPFKLVKTASLDYYNQFIRRVVTIIPAPGKEITPSSDHNTNGMTLQFNSTFGNNYLVAGIDAWQRSYKGIRTTENSIAGVKIIDKPIPDSYFGSIGIFMNDEVYFSKEVKLTFGSRYDFIGISNEGVENPIQKFVGGNEIAVAPNPDASFEKGSYNNKSWSGNVGLIYSFTKSFDFTMMLANAFRSPSLEERFQYINLGGIIYLGNPELEPERSSSVNTGLRFYGQSFSVRANAYANYFNNLVVDDIVVSDSLYKKSNVGKARYYGFETEFEGKVSSIHLRATLSYVNGKDVETNRPLPQIPPLNATFQLTFPYKDLLSLTLGTKLFADKKDVPEDENENAGYVVYSLRITTKSFSIGSYKLSLLMGVENIFNRKYRNYLSTYRGISLTEPGRNIFVKVFVRY